MKKTLSLAVTVLYRDFSDFCESILQESGLSKGLLFFLLILENIRAVHTGRFPPTWEAIMDIRHDVSTG